MLPKFAYVKARSVAEAVRELGTDGARVHSGGSDLIGCLRDGVFTAEKVVSLSAIKELKGITKLANGGISIGGMTPVKDVAADASIAEHYPTLHHAARVIASPQLRNQGTLAGNICQRPRCWYYRGDYHCAKKGGEMCYAYDGENVYHAIFGGDPCYIVHPSDSAPALISLGASIVIAGPQGSRTLPLEQFFVLPADDLYHENVLKPGEVVTQILLPPPAGVKGIYRKIRTRESWDFAIVSAAITVKVEGGVVKQSRIVLGGVAPKPWPVPEADKALIGKKIDMASAKEAAEAALKGAKPLAQNAYKIEMAKGAIIDALLALA